MPTIRHRATGETSSPHARATNLQRESPTCDGAPVTERRGAHSPQEPTGARWYALKLRSHFEFTVRDALRAADITEYLPTYPEVTRWSDREKTITRPIFAGYLFARFPLARVNEIRQTRGVIEILSIDHQPVSIPDSEIAALRRAVDSRAQLSPCAYVAGDTVRVERGPFAGVSGVVSRVKGATLLTIPVEILGRAVSVEIEAADVEKN